MDISANIKEILQHASESDKDLYIQFYACIENCNFDSFFNALLLIRDCFTDLNAFPTLRFKTEFRKIIKSINHNIGNTNKHNRSDEKKKEVKDLTALIRLINKYNSKDDCKFKHLVTIQKRCMNLNVIMPIRLNDYIDGCYKINTTRKHLAILSLLLLECKSYEVKYDGAKRIITRELNYVLALQPGIHRRYDPWPIHESVMKLDALAYNKQVDASVIQQFIAPPIMTKAIRS